MMKKLIASYVGGTLLLLAVLVVMAVMFFLGLRIGRKDYMASQLTPYTQSDLVPPPPLQRPRVEAPSPTKPTESFYIEGTSVIHELTDGKKEIAITDLPSKMTVGIEGSVDIIAHTEENTAILAAGCWEGNGMRRLYRLDATAKTLTAMNSEAPCFSYVEPEQGDRLSQYLVYPGGEADRFIMVDLRMDTSTEVAILPKPYTYIRNGDESGYSAFITGDIKWNGNSFEAEVYDGGVPIELFDYRLPIMVKNIR